MSSPENPDEYRDYKAGPSFNTSYLCSVQGYLSCIESAFLLIAFILAQFYGSFYSPPHLPFFFATTFVGFFLLVVFYLFFLFSLDKLYDSYNWYLLDVFFSACLAVFLIVSAGLLAHEANFVERHGKEFTSWFSDRLVGAVVLAFAVVLFLIIDIIYSLYLYRKAMKGRAHR